MFDAMNIVDESSPDTLEIKVPAGKVWDEDAQRFFVIDKEQTIVLKHSLISISKWESIWHKPFLAKKPPKTGEEVVSYIKCMTINKNVNPYAYYSIPESEMVRIEKYMNDPKTARRPNSDNDKRRSNETPTAEVIRGQMILLNIPSEYETWHINRLWALIRYMALVSTPPKKVSSVEHYKHYKELNAMRRKMLGSKG